jgi:hypothetical protein
MSSAEQLADRAFRAAEYDFGRLLDIPGAILSRGDRQGVRLLVAPTAALPDAALDAILGWRLGQYLLTGFYDPDVVAGRGMLREDAAGVHAGDVHGLAIDREGGLLTYLTLKQPEGLQGCAYGDPNRPSFPCEEVHGRSWQGGIVGTDGIPAEATWEAARFVTDQRRKDDPNIHRGALEIALAAARLARNPDFAPLVRLVTGDLDPEVALRNLRYFFIPVATFAPHQVTLPDGHPLKPRYAAHPTAPFIANPADMDWATYVRWSDIDLALRSGEEETYLRFLALRQFVSVKESSLKRPNPPDGDAPYPAGALTSPSSLEASEALWESAKAKEIPWQARALGPGEALPREHVCWVVEGFAQALTYRPEGLAHLAGVGPEVCWVPHDAMAGSIAALEASTPLRVLTTSRDEFERFWRLRQSLFETSTENLYGLDEVVRAAR